MIVVHWKIKSELASVLRWGLNQEKMHAFDFNQGKVEPLIKPRTLRLSGTDFEMAKTHGMAAKEAGALDALHFFASFTDEVFSYQVRSGLDRFLRKVFRAWVAADMETRFIEQIPSRDRLLVEGFALGSGLSKKEVCQAFVMPDLQAFLLGRFVGRMQAWIPNSLNAGCTSFVMRPDHKEKKSLLHARNLDFLGGEAWSNFPAIIEMAPQDGQRYVSIGSLGVMNAGITAVNEAGVALSLHMNYSRAVSDSGVPVVAIGHEVVRHAKNLREAVDILSALPKTAGWSYAISSAQEGAAVVVECDANRMAVRGMNEGGLVLTNHFLDSNLSAHEYWITPARRADTLNRFNRTKALLEAAGAGLSANEAVAILRDSHDPTLGRSRAFGSTICQVHTLTSVIFDATHKRIYVANGPAPVPKRTYTAYDVFPGPTERTPSIEGEEESLENRARRQYVLAHDAYFPKADLERVCAHLHQASEIHPDEAMYWLMLGLTRLKQHRAQPAQKAFEKVSAVASDEIRGAWGRLWLARVADLLGERDRALTLYRSLVEHPHLGRRAGKGLRGRFGWRRVDRLFLDFTLGEAIGD